MLFNYNLHTARNSKIEGVTGVVEVVEQEVDCMIRQVVFLVVGGFEQLPLLAQSTRRKIIHRTEFRKELGVNYDEIVELKGAVDA